MSEKSTGGSRFLYAPFDAANARIEANERVGLANHEPQPTAQCFVDLLFPLSAAAGSHHYSVGGQQ